MPCSCREEAGSERFTGGGKVRVKHAHHHADHHNCWLCWRWRRQQWDNEDHNKYDGYHISFFQSNLNGNPVAKLPLQPHALRTTQELERVERRIAECMDEGHEKFELVVRFTLLGFRQPLLLKIGTGSLSL